ncbi:DUF2059 domain-containing protein [Chitinimonas sp. BJYL2]|uniref:DUF2059 domain-containing protein n=1 Tax=Chitinimonas sp. BJYL2 TaxID=2976696 RepID=UPI0022B3D43F|nr:DUF2059 domain-containing protein [Chitinimonas sp. BJYL2]
MKNLIRYTLAIAAALCLQQVSAADISAEKKQAIQELIDVMNMKAMLPQLLNQIAEQADMGMQAGMEAALKQNNKRDEAEQARLRQQLNEELPALKQDMRQVLEQANLPALMDEILFEVYGKYFEAAEIRDITAFYKSPTGKKVLVTLPKITGESMQLTMARIMPIVQAQLEKTQARIKQKVAATQP